jgi:DNA-directed RNA polymerase subunit RPC12/RpoP
MDLRDKRTVAKTENNTSVVSYFIDVPEDTSEARIAHIVAKEVGNKAPFSQTVYPIHIEFQNDKVCNSREEAEEFLNTLAYFNNFVSIYAVKYKDASFVKNAEFKDVRSRMNIAVNAYYIARSEFHFADSKEDTVECKSCGSRISVNKLKERMGEERNFCPVCGGDLRPEKALERIEKFAGKRAELVDEYIRVKKDARLYANAVDNAEINCLIRIEYYE